MLFEGSTSMKFGVLTVEAISVSPMRNAAIMFVSLPPPKQHASSRGLQAPAVVTVGAGLFASVV
jgi:hypothetical protein